MRNGDANLYDENVNANDKCFKKGLSFTTGKAQGKISEKIRTNRRKYFG